MIRSIPLCCPFVLAHFVPDVLDAAENRKYLPARATVLGSKLAGEALPVAEAPVDDQPGESLAVDGPSPRGVQIMAPASNYLGYVRSDCGSCPSCDQLSPVANPRRPNRVDPVRGDFRQPLVSAVAHHRDVLIVGGNLRRDNRPLHKRRRQSCGGDSDRLQFAGNQTEGRWTTRRELGTTPIRRGRIHL